MTTVEKERITKLLAKSSPKIQAYLNIFFEQLQKTKTARGFMAPKTIYNNLRRVEYFFREYCHNSLENYTVDTIAAYCDERNNAANQMVTFKRFSKILFTKGIIYEDDYTAILKLQYKNNKIVRYEIGKEYKFIIPYARWAEIYNHPAIKKFQARIMACYMALNFTLREGEIINLKQKDLFLEAEDPFIYIQPHKEDEWHPKTLNGIRRIFLLPHQVQQFKWYLTWRKQFLQAIHLEHDFIIINAEGGPVAVASNIYDWITAVSLTFDELGMKIERKLRPHALRYSACWFYFQKTRNLYAVSKLAGHGSVSETEKYLGLTQAQIFTEIKQMMLQAFSN